MGIRKIPVARLIADHYAIAVLGLSIVIGLILVLRCFNAIFYPILFNEDGTRLLVCLMVALFPLGNHALVTNLTFSIINIFAIALLLLVAELPGSLAGRITQFILIGLAVFSHPFSILFVPVCLGLIVLRRSRADRIFNGGIVGLVGIYYLVGVHPSAAGLSLSLPSLQAAAESILQRVVFEPIFGNSLYESFTELAWGQRYFLVQQIFVLLVLVVHLVGLTRWDRLTVVARSAVAVFALVFAGYLNLHHAPYYATSRDHGKMTMQFLRDVDSRLSRSGMTGLGACRKTSRRALQ